MVPPLPLTDQERGHYRNKKLAKDKIAAMVGQEVTVSSKSSGAVMWKVIASMIHLLSYQKVNQWSSKALRILI